MYRFFFIAKNNMKKQRKDMITFFMLTFIAAALIFISLAMFKGIDGLIYDLHDRTDSADIMVLMGGRDKANEARMEEIIRGTGEIDRYDIAEYAVTNGKYRHKGSKRWTDYGLYFLKSDTGYVLQRPSIDVSKIRDNEIIAPIALKASFKKGDTIEFKIEDSIYEFKIAGFNEDTYFCSPMNMSSYLFFVTPGAYADLTFDNPETIIREGLRYSLVVGDPDADLNAVSDRIENEYIEWRASFLASHPGYDLSVSYNFLPRELMYTAGKILPYMFVAMAFLFAVIIFVISLVIIDFSIKNFIMTNMKNTAIMEASGYTVKEMVLILLTQLLSVAGIGSILGVLAGALSLNKVGFVMYYLLGLEWNRPIDLGVAVVVVAAVCVLVILLTLLLGREYAKTSVLDALRGGVNTYNFRRNHFSFDKTFLPVPVTLALKETFGRFRNQVGVIFIAAVLTISAIIGMGMVDTFASSNEAAMNLSGSVFEDAEVDLESESMLDEINSMSTVEFAYGDVHVTIEASKGRKRQNISARCFTDTSHIAGGGLAEGRWPKHNNEVMLAMNAAKAFGVGVGDTINVKYGENEETYLICGLNQTFNNLGYISFFTMDGINRISGVKPSTAEVKIKSNFTYEDFEKEFKERYPDVDVVSIEETAANIINIVVGSVKVTAVFIALLTCIIIAFVESLVIRTQINREWRNLGVSKALGYTSGQLIWQTVLSNLPSVLIGVVIGLLVGGKAGEKGCYAMFSIFGYKKVDFMVYPTSYLLTALLIISVAMITSGLIGKRIKTLEPVKMITEE